MITSSYSCIYLGYVDSDRIETRISFEDHHFDQVSWLNVEILVPSSKDGKLAVEKNWPYRNVSTGASVYRDFMARQYTARKREKDNVKDPPLSLPI